MRMFHHGDLFNGISGSARISLELVRVQLMKSESVKGKRYVKQIAPSLLLILSLFTSSGSAAEKPPVLPVWPDQVPGDYGTIGAERVRAPSEAPTKDAKWITNVTKPTITVFRPGIVKNTGAAMVICPGGGYWNLAWDLEGEEVAAWLNTLGMTGIVLKYRVPRRPGQPKPLPAPGPLLPTCSQPGSQQSGRMGN
jgi:hypothetical protein